jgi:hypothetical protein
MSDTQSAAAQSPSNLDVRLQSLSNTHAQYRQKLSRLDQEREATIASLLKLEGALEALADLKSEPEFQNQTESTTSSETSSEAPKEESDIVDATFSEN